jgi:hypothetical protein
MPSLHNRVQIELYLNTDPIQFSRRKSIVARQREWREPVLANLVLPLNMYVLRIVAVETVKEKPVRSGKVPNGSAFWVFRTAQASFYRNTTRFPTRTGGVAGHLLAAGTAGLGGSGSAGVMLRCSMVLSWLSQNASSSSVSGSRFSMAFAVQGFR